MRTPPGSARRLPLALAGPVAPRSKPNSSGSADTQALKFAQCMRANGVTGYPDPTSNGRPQSLNQIDSNSPTSQTAYKVCQKYAPNGESGPPVPSAAQLRRALVFAQCMRAHGFPQFPDPLTTAPDQPNLTLGQGDLFPSPARPISSRRHHSSGRQPRPAECSFPEPQPSATSSKTPTRRLPRYRARRGLASLALLAAGCGWGSTSPTAASRDDHIGRRGDRGELIASDAKLGWSRRGCLTSQPRCHTPMQ